MSGGFWVIFLFQDFSFFLFLVLYHCVLYINDNCKPLSMVLDFIPYCLGDLEVSKLSASIFPLTKWGYEYHLIGFLLRIYELMNLKFLENS